MSETAAVGTPRVGSGALNALASRAPAVLLALTIVTIPLESTEEWFPNQVFTVGRFVMFGLLVTFLGMTVWGHRRIVMPAWRLWVPPAIFIAYAVVSALVSHSLAGLKTAGAMLTYSLVAVVVFNWTRRLRGQDFVWLWFAVSCIGLSLIAIAERVTGQFVWRAPSAGPARLSATLGDPNIFARVLVCVIVGAVMLAPLVAGRRARAVLIVAAVISAAVLPFTYSRDAWAIGGIVLVVAVLIAERKKQSLAIAAAALVAFVAITVFVPQVQARFGNIQQGLTSGPTHLFNRPGLAFLNYLPLDSERHYLIAAGLQMFYDHPVAGIGYGRFPDEMAGAYHDFVLPGYKTVNSHTSLVTIVAEMGVVGTILVLWWLIEYIRLSLVAAGKDRARRPYLLAPLLCVVVIVLTSQLQARLVDEPYLWIFLGLAWAATAPERGLEEKAGASQPIATTTSAATSQNSTARSFFQ